MRVVTHTLDITQFKSDLDSFLPPKFRNTKGSVLNDAVARINAVKADIPSFLMSVDEIENEEVQRFCRLAAIAQMYNANTDYRCGYPYVGSRCNNWVMFIQCEQYINSVPILSTCVVSKYGDIIIDEGQIKVLTGSNHGYGWTVTSVVDGKDGLISNYGDVLIPCSFDRIHYGMTCFLNYVSFELRAYGKQSELEPSWVEQLRYHCEDDMYDYIICRSRDGVLYELKANHFFTDSNGQIEVDEDNNACEVGSVAYREALKKVKMFMSPFILTQEELKTLLATITK